MTSRHIMKASRFLLRFGSLETIELWYWLPRTVKNPGQIDPYNCPNKPLQKSRFLGNIVFSSRQLVGLISCLRTNTAHQLNVQHVRWSTSYQTSPVVLSCFLPLCRRRWGYLQKCKIQNKYNWSLWIYCNIVYKNAKIQSYINILMKHKNAKIQ